MPLLSVIVLTHNEEVNLPACLQSLQGLDCEMLVVDSGSADRTKEIAEAAGARVFHHPFENYAAQRNWAMEHLPAACEWLLHLDADERLTPDLTAEIARTVRTARPEVAGYMLRKRTIFMGRWIRHGGHYPSYHLRLFRRGAGRCEDRLYDQHFIVKGAIERLHHDYIDIVSSNLGAWTRRHEQWAELETDELMSSNGSGHRVGADPLGNPIQRRRWYKESVYGSAPLFARAFAYWFYRYFIRLGFLDGKEGLVFHFLQGCWFRFLIDAMIHERRTRGGVARDS